MEKSIIKKLKVLNTALLTGALVLVTSGCEKKKDSYYKENPIANTFVADIDGNIAVVQIQDISSVFDFVKHNGVGKKTVDINGDLHSVESRSAYETNFNKSIEILDTENGGHNHYVDILTGAQYADNPYCTGVISHLKEGKTNYQKAEVTLIEPFVNSLTNEEIVKAQKGELTQEELVSIITRTTNEYKESEKTY